MKAEEIAVARLFQSGEQLLIPLWQRHYSWERAHWEELWTDLNRVREKGLTSHFLGSIVLKSLTWSGLPSEAKRYWVVDGQQRVATLTVLVCAMRDRIASFETSAEAREVKTEEYTSQLLRNLNLKEAYQDRLILQERDRATLAPIVRGEWDAVPGTLIERCYLFFKQCLAEFDASTVEEFLRITLTRLSAVWVILEEGDNAHRVFQTLNAGGKPLHQADLVRNYFFLLLGDHGDEFYKTYWRRFESDFSEREIESYFVAWTISEGHTGAKGELYRFFHQDLQPYETDTEKVLRYGTNLFEVSRYFRWIRQPAESGFSAELKQTMQDLAAWSTTPGEGLILLLLRLHADDRLASSDLRDGLEIVLSFMARRQLAGYEPNLHRPIFASVARRLHAAKLLGSKELVGYLRYCLSDDKDKHVWPTDDEIIAAAARTPIYSPRRSAWTFAILERINRGLFEIPKHVPTPLDRMKYSVEHVMPQTLTGTWEADLSSWGEKNPNQLHEKSLHVLGNLTLTPINSELSNLPFAAKVKMLQDDWLRLNSAVSASTTWTEQSIHDRSIELARVACRMYVAPLSGAELQEARIRFEALKEPQALEPEEDQDVQV